MGFGCSLGDYCHDTQDFELTVRSNDYISTIARVMDGCITRVNAEGINHEGSLITAEGEVRNEIQVSQWDGDTYQRDFMEHIMIPKGRSVSELVMIHNVHDISQEQQMARNKSLQFAFYDSHQFGVSRGYL